MVRGVLPKILIAAFVFIAVIVVLFNTPGYLLNIRSFRKKESVLQPDRKRIFTEESVLQPYRKRNFTILDWSPAFFSRENKLPVNAMFDNCLVTRNKSRLTDSDAVVVEVRNIPYLKDMPPSRKPWQRWVYFNIEPPYYAMLDYVGHYKMTDFKGDLAFNWSMTYRTDADAPMLHGWSVKKTEKETIETKNQDIVDRKKTKLAAGMISNCHYVTNGRGRYIKELQKYISVEVYGKCGTLKCEGHYTKNACEKLKDYKFFFAFENSNCRDYISFKMWMQGFGNGAVPVVLGAYKEDYIKQAPPHSFIHVGDFKSPKEVADYLKYLDKNSTAYNEFQAWRREYRIDYDYRFMGSYAWTKLCTALNAKYQEPAKWYNVITDFESPEKNCFQNQWVKSVCKNKPCT